MNNLHRELAPISETAWAGIEEEARRTFALHVAGRRVADMPEPAGPTLAAVGTGHLADAEPPADGVVARLRRAQPMVELRVPFILSRQAIDDVERGAKDPDWQPVKDAARTIALAEDRAIFEGYPPGQITGVRLSSAHPALALPADVRGYPRAVSEAVSSLRLAGVGGPYLVLLSADAYTAVNETSDHGYLIRDHLARVAGGDVIWAPAIDGVLVLSGRGGDYELHLGQDLSLGYLTHDGDRVQLYLQESMTFQVHTGEAAAGLTARPA